MSEDDVRVDWQYIKYNAVLRRFPLDVVKDLRGNKYVNAITALVSAIMKLAAVAPIPKDRIVWRGVSVSIPRPVCPQSMCCDTSIVLVADERPDN